MTGTDNQGMEDHAVAESSTSAQLDLTSDPEVRKNEEPKEGDTYDPRPGEDQARKCIAYLLIGILALSIAGIFLLISFGKAQISDLKEFSTLLGPLTTLVSAATGFYYGTKSQQ